MMVVWDVVQGSGPSQSLRLGVIGQIDTLLSFLINPHTFILIRHIIRLRRDFDLLVNQLLWRVHANTKYN